MLTMKKPLSACLTALLLACSVSLGQSPPKGIWLTPAEIKSLPNTGPAWEAMKAEATGSWSTPSLSNQDSKANCQVLAGAYYAVHTGSLSMVEKVRAAVKKIPATIGGRTLALGRELPAYVIAIDLVGWATQAEEDSFKSFLRSARTKELDGKTLISTQEVRPNNWGTQASFALVVVDIYLGDGAGLARRAQVFRGWLGDRAAYAGFTYGALDWQANQKLPVGINPKGSQIDGHSVDGALPEEMRRHHSDAEEFVWPPPCENYVWTGYTPALAAAWVLSRVPAYADVFSWSDAALLRAIRWQHAEADCPAEGNDVGTSWLANSIFGSTFRVSSPASMSREIAWLDWTHAKPWKPAPPPPDPDPVPEDFMVSFNFLYQEASKSWTVNLNPTNGFKPGAGLTPSAALADWMVKNPGAP